MQGQESVFQMFTLIVFLSIKFCIHCKMLGSDTRTIREVVWHLLALVSLVPDALTTPYSVVFPSSDVYVKGPLVKKDMFI